MLAGKFLVHVLSAPGIPKGGIHAGPEVDQPSHEKNPGHAGTDKKQDRREDAALDQLPESWKKETAKRCDHIPAGSLTC